VGFVKSIFGDSAKHGGIALMQQLFLHAPVPTVITDETGVIVMCNGSFSDLTGYAADEAEGERMSLLKSGRHDHAFYREMWDKLTAEGAFEGEIWCRHKDRSLILLSEKIRRIFHDERYYYIGMLEDITERKKLTQRYQHLATHDALTGLANRILLQDRFSHAALNATRNGKKVGLLMCDLNSFKRINDTYGHNFGDTVLREVSKRLTQFVRISDTVARYGGDEFMLILEQIEHSDEVLKVVEQLNTIFPITHEIGGQRYKVGISVGYACFPDEGASLEQLVAQADAKMYRAKERYRGYSL